MELLIWNIVLSFLSAIILWVIKSHAEEVQRIQILLYNEGMFKMMTIAEGSAESGVQERELDLRKYPSGSYAILLKTPQSQSSCLLEHVFR